MVNVVSIAARVAAELGDGWAATDGHWTNHEDAFLVNRKVIGRIHVALRDGRIRIGGSLPEGWSEYQPASWMSDVPEDPRISVAPDKAPGRIAGDITRRFLPGWFEYSQWTERRKTQSERHKAATAATAEWLAAMVSGAVVSGNERDEIDLYRVAGVSHGKVRVHADGGVRIDGLSLDSAGAAAFFRALGKLSE